MLTVYVIGFNFFRKNKFLNEKQDILWTLVLTLLSLVVFIFFINKFEHLKRYVPDFKFDNDDVQFNNVKLIDTQSNNIQTNKELTNQTLLNKNKLNNWTDNMNLTFMQN